MSRMADFETAMTSVRQGRTLDSGEITLLSQHFQELERQNRIRMIFERLDARCAR